MTLPIIDVWMLSVAHREKSLLTIQHQNTVQYQPLFEVSALGDRRTPRGRAPSMRLRSKNCIVASV